MSSNKKLISVIMPVYNSSSSLLKKSIDSILSQTYDNLELITVMDRSSPEVDNEILTVIDSNKDDHRLKNVLHTTKKGLVASLNDGISLSKGQYIARADCDDISSSERLECQLTFLEENRNDLVGSWAYVTDRKERIIGKLKLPTDSKSIRNSIMIHNVILHSSVLMKKEVLENVGGYNPAFRGSEDYELWLRILSNGYSLGNCPMYLLYLRESPESITRGKNWFENRVAYFKSKGYACCKYHYLRPVDVSCCVLSLASLMVLPSMSLSVKKLLRIFNEVPSELDPIYMPD